MGHPSRGQEGAESSTSRVRGTIRNGGRDHDRQLVFQQALGIQPFEKKRWPIGNWRWIALANAKAMAHPRVNVKLSGYVETAQRKIEFCQALRDVGPVVASAGQKSARRLGGEPRVMRNSRIQKRLEVWLGTGALHKVF
jgi:hypothetical protein